MIRLEEDRKHAGNPGEVGEAPTQDRGSPTDFRCQLPLINMALRTRLNDIEQY